MILPIGLRVVPLTVSTQGCSPRSLTNCGPANCFSIMRFCLNVDPDGITVIGVETDRVPVGGFNLLAVFSPSIVEVVPTSRACGCGSSANLIDG